MTKPKVLIVGSGLVGSTIARLMQLKFSHLVQPILIDANPISKSAKSFVGMPSSSLDALSNCTESHLFTPLTLFPPAPEVGNASGENGQQLSSESSQWAELARGISTLRNSALAPSSITLLDRIIADERLKNILWKSGRRFSGMKVWDGTIPSRTSQSTISCMNFSNAYGWIGPNEIIQNVLLRELNEDGMHVTHASIKKIIPKTSSINNNFSDAKSLVTLQYFADEDPKTPAGQEDLEVDLIIGCDGAMSPVRQMAAIPFVHNEYEQRAFVTTVRINDPSLNVAMQRFIPTGPIALLPIGEGICNIVWSTTPEHAHHLNSLSDADLCNAINIAFNEPFGGAPIESYYHDANFIDRIASFASNILNSVGPSNSISVPLITDIVPNKPIKKGSFPLRQIHAKRYVKNGIVLAGDAAHAVHPLAGQGVNLGFADAAQLMHAFDVAEASGMRLSSETILQQEYEKSRYLQNEIHIQFFNCVKELFANPHETVGLVRGVGMFGINSMPLVTSYIESLASYKMDYTHIPYAAASRRSSSESP